VRRLSIAGAALLMILAGCSAEDSTAKPASTGAEARFLDAYGLGGMDVTEIIDHLDRIEADDRPTELTASVRPDELLLSDGERQVALDMPRDRYYLSVAPYVDRTHDCFYHSLTTCQGELTGEEIHVRIVDDETGEVLVDKRTTTFDNGFVGFWLPRDIDGTITVSHDGRIGTADFTTTDEGATCVTTLRLT
jgi:hypothetical protein